MFLETTLLTLAGTFSTASSCYICMICVAAKPKMYNHPSFGEAENKLLPKSSVSWYSRNNICPDLCCLIFLWQ